MMMSTIVGFENPAYASAGASVRVSTAAAIANTEAVRIGKAPITTDRMVAAKMANRCHACALRSPGGGMNQRRTAMPSATARLTRAPTGGALLPTRSSGAALVVTANPWCRARLTSLACQGRRVEDLVELFVGQDVLLADQLHDALAVLQRLGRKLGGLVVADDGIEGRHGPDAELDIVLEDVRVGGDAVDAERAQRPRRVDQERLALEDDGGDHWLECVELQLAAFRGERHDEVVPDDPIGNHVGHFGDDRVHLAGHDGRS